MVPPKRPEARIRPLNLDAAAISPAAAVAALEGDSSRSIRALSLIQIHDRTVYRIDAGRRPVLVDASDGSRVEITAALAEAIARDALNRKEGTATVVELRKHDSQYTTGSLPAWRVTFAEGGDPVHVTQADGAFVPAGSRSRFRALAHDMHNFSIIREVVAANWFYRSLAILAGLVSIAGILTGYWLSLPPRRRRRKVRSTEPMSVQR
jgi:hypothetical protein